MKHWVQVPTKDGWQDFIGTDDLADAERIVALLKDARLKPEEEECAQV